MPYARSRAARHRELARNARALDAARRKVETLEAARLALWQDDQNATDRSTLQALADASQLSESAVRKNLRQAQKPG